MRVLVAVMLTIFCMCEPVVLFLWLRYQRHYVKLGVPGLFGANNECTVESTQVQHQLMRRRFSIVSVVSSICLGVLCIESLFPLSRDFHKRFCAYCGAELHYAAISTHIPFEWFIFHTSLERITVYLFMVVVPCRCALAVVRCI